MGERVLYPAARSLEASERGHGEMGFLANLGPSFSTVRHGPGASGPWGELQSLAGVSRCTPDPRKKVTVAVINQHPFVFFPYGFGFMLSLKIKIVYI